MIGSQSGMSSRKRNCQFAAGLATLLACAVLLSCDGFFVDPILTSITVGPSTTIQTGTTVQMSAVGTYNDGSQSKLSNILWSSDTPNVAKVNSSGLVTGVEPGQATITGAKETATGTATISVTISGLSSITVTNQDGVTSIAYGESEQFVATGTSGGQQFDITDSVTWTTSPASIQNVTISSSSGLMVTVSGPTTLVQFQVVATDPTTGISGTMTFLVHP